MPWDYRPWGCGSGSKGSCNDGWIQFEICEDALTDKAYFDKVYKEAVEITAYLCKMYNLNPKGTVTKNGVKVPVILDHTTSCSLGFGSNHGDVKHWFSRYGKTLNDVRNDVAKLMGESDSTPSTPTTPSTSTMYRVRKAWKDAASQKGAYTVLENAKKCCDQAGAGYYVFDGNGKVVYPAEGAISANLKEGDVIELVSGATYWDGKAIPSWVFKSKLYCRGFRGGNKDNVIFSTLKTGAITGVVNKKHIVGHEEEFKPYIVRVTVDVLNIRAGAGSNYALKGTITDRGAYTIVEEKNGYGRLKSGAGWIYLDYTKKV
jgi:hypothetical protein